MIHWFLSLFKCKHEKIEMIDFYPRTKFYDCRCAKCGAQFCSHFNQPGTPCVKTQAEFEALTKP